MNAGSDKAVVLHVCSASDAKAYAESLAEVYESLGELVIYKSRELTVETSSAFIKFTTYRKDLPSSAQEGICGQYSHIFFHAEVPEQVKNHFLSRIRKYGVEYAEPS